MGAYRLPFGTILLRQAAICRPPTQHSRWASLGQSPTKIAEVRIAPLLAAVQVMATALVQIGVIAAFE
ncbi:hypothetical protein X738_30070 [Mesorhizobium sp. LNHC209A00]|nr:hypothetical protein X738_30070 [Mesorhizobium sp. LNHC209A00]